MKRLKKVISVLLMLSMILSVMPVITLTASTSAFASSNDDYSVFDALGIDVSVTPEGFNADNDDNPYGTSIINITPVWELFTADSDGKKLYGHNKPFLEENEDYYEGESINSASISTDGMSYFNTVSGDFTGNGLESEIVVIGAGFEDTYEEDKLTEREINTFQLFFDSTDDDTDPSNTIELKEQEDFGLVNEDFKSNKNLIYNYLQLATGDFTGDGRDEIAVFQPEQGKSKVLIYQLQIPSGQTAENSWSDATNWEPLYSYDISANGLVPNKVALLAADLTGNGIDDLAIAWGIAQGDYKVKSQVKVLKGSKQNSDRFEDIDVVTDDLYKAAIAIGDVNGNRKNELVVSGVPVNYNNQFIHLAYYDFDHENSVFIRRASNDIPAFSSGSSDGNFNTQLTTIKLESRNQKQHIFVDGGVFELVDGNFIYIYDNYIPKTMNTYQVNAVDLTGDGRDELIVKLDANKTSIRRIDDSSSKQTLVANFDDKKYVTFCNTDEDTIQMRFIGKRVVYSDPSILAVLASPPYFKDLQHLDGGDDYVGDSATTFGTIKGDSATQTQTSTISAGTYVSFEQEFSFFGISAASVEAEAEFSKSWTKETEETNSRTQTIEYATAGGQDTVVLYSIPLVIYEYETSVPVVNGDTMSWEKQRTTITEPREATIRTYTLKAYDEIAKYYDVLPTVGDNILTHKLGNPATYPTSTAGYRFVNQPDGPSIGVGYGSGGSITQTLELTQEKSVGTSASTSISTKAGGGAGGVTVGVTAGSEEGSGTVKTSLNGRFFSTTIVGMPEEAVSYGYDYNVKMFQYIRNYAGKNIPVVNYVVSELSMPPIVPDDFGLDREGTTSNQIKLTWTDEANGDNVVGYQIFRKYDFPEGSADFPVAFVESNKKDSNGVLSYIDTDLEPNTEYRYKIQVLANQIPDRSVISDVLTVKTRADVGIPEISLDGIEDNVARVYPDVEKQIRATVTNSETSVGTPFYQWQKYVTGQWRNLSGKTSDTLTFTDSNLSVNGEYRLRVNQFVNENAISVFSDVFSVEFSKRDVEIEGDGIIITPDPDNNDKVALSINLSNSASSSNPTGNVIFDIIGEGYALNVAKPLDNNATAELRKINLPNHGLYSINAYYGGNKIFNAIESDVKYLKGDETSFWLEVEDREYGEQLSPVITKYEIDEDGRQTSSVISDEEYAIDYTWTNKADGSTVSEAINVGEYSLEAVVTKDDQTATLITDVFITQRPITITAPTLQRTRSEAKTPSLDILTAVPELVAGDTFDNLGLQIVCLNNSGRRVTTFNPETSGEPLPGRYTVRVISKDNISDEERTKQSNYLISFEDGTYTVIGATHSVTMIADELLSKKVGSIELFSPDDFETLEFQQNTILRFRATSDPGYEVDKWFVKTNLSNPDSTYVQVDPTEEDVNVLRYEMPGEAIEVKVTFKVKDTSLFFSAPNGTITCVEIPHLKSGDVVTKNGTYTFAAVANEGYHFVRWEKTENVTSYPAGTTDANGNPQIAVTIGDLDVELVAVFERDSYQLNLGDNLKAYYMENGDKVYITGNTVVGDTVVTVEPAVGYMVSQDAQENYLWNSNATGDIGDGGQTYTFTIKENTFIDAMLETTELTGNINISEASFGNNEIILKINGIETPYTLGQDFSIESGSTITLEPRLDYGAKLEEYIYGNTNSTDEILILKNVVESFEVTALFEELPKYEIDFSDMYNTLHGSLTIQVKGQNVELDQNNNLPVYKGDAVSITAYPNSGYMVGYWTIDGVRTYTNEKSRKLENIIANHKVTCEFIPMVYYTLNYGVGQGGGGAVSAQKDGYIQVNTGEAIGGSSKVEFSVSPSNGHMVEKWEVNGVKQLNEFGETYIDKTFTIEALSAHSNVTVYFKDEVTHDVSVTQPSGGTISGVFLPDDYQSNVNVRDGAAYEITVTPYDDYRIEAVSAAVYSDNETVIFSEYCDETQLVSSSVYSEAPFYNVIKGIDDPWICTINSVKGDVTVSAITARLYDLSVGTFKGGTVDITPSRAPNKVRAVEGEEVYILATVANGYRFNGWNVVDEEDNKVDTYSKHAKSTTFVMPAGNVIVTPVFRRATGTGGGAPIAPETPVERHPVDVAVEEGTRNAEGKIVATIQVEDANNVGVYEQDIPKDFFSYKDSILEIATPVGTVTLPDEMFDELPGEDVKLSIQQVDAQSITLSEEVKEKIGDKPIIDINLSIGGQKVKWQSDDKEISIAIPYTLSDQEKANPHKVIAIYIDDNGNITPITVSHYDADKGKMVLKTKHTSYYSLQYADKRFNDIGAYIWAQESIEALAARGVINGVSETEFAPDNNITRADFVVLVTRFLRLGNSGNTNFTDVEIGTYYYDAIATAKDLGIVTGSGDNKFNPLEPITRQDMMVIIERALRITNVTGKLTTDSGKSLNDFIDSEDISDYATSSVEYLIKKSVVSGDGMSINPKSNTKRAEVAALLYKLLAQLNR